MPSLCLSISYLDVISVGLYQGWAFLLVWKLLRMIQTFTICVCFFRMSAFFIDVFLFGSLKRCANIYVSLYVRDVCCNKIGDFCFKTRVPDKLRHCKFWISSTEEELSVIAILYLNSTYFGILFCLCSTTSALPNFLGIS